MNAALKETNSEVVSTRITPTLQRRVREAAKQLGAAESDLAREGLARIAAEFERHGSIRFGEVLIVAAKRREKRKAKAARKASKSAA